MISSNIKILREEARLTREELASKIDITVNDLILIEKGKIIPNEDLVKKMCPYLRISYEDICSRDIVEERKEAGRKMLRAGNLSTYRWYYNPVIRLIYYIGYIILIGILFIIISQFTDYLLAYLITGGIAGIYIVIGIIKRFHLRFQIYYIIFFPILLTIVIILGNIVMIPYIFHALYVIIFKQGKR